MYHKLLEPFKHVMTASTSDMWVSELLDIMRKSSEELYDHSVFVALLTANLALFGDTSVLDEFGNDVTSLIVGALLHDIGYICNMGKTVGKPRKEMSAVELQMFERHIEDGLDKIKQYTDNQIIIDILAMHHEYIDGSGFPNGLKGDEIPPYVKLVSIANAFVSYLSRTQSQGLEISETISRLRDILTDECYNGRYDLDMVVHFFDNLTNTFSPLEPILAYMTTLNKEI